MSTPNTLGSANTAAGAGGNNALSNPLMSAIGLIGGRLSWQNPADSAMGYLNQIPAELQKYLSPYIGAGGNALNLLQTQGQNLLSDPNALLNQIGAGYKASPAYQYNVNQATNAANRAAAAGGMAGSPAEQQQLASNISQLSSEDFYNYVDRAMQNYNTGLGIMGGIEGQGYGASNTMANDMATNLMNQAKMQYAETQNQNQADAGFWGGITGLFGGGSGGGGGSSGGSKDNSMSTSDLSNIATMLALFG